MSGIKSESEKLSHRARDFFLPSAPEAILFSLLSVILLAVFNTSSMISYLNNSFLKGSSLQQASYSVLFSHISSSFNQALNGRLVQMLLWAFMGAAIYIFIWLAKNVLNSFENDIISDHYLHPTSYSHIGYWSSSLSVKTFLLADVLIAVTYGYFLFKALIPALAALASSAAHNFKVSTSPLYMLACILAGAVLLHLLLLLLRFTSHLWKLL